jgi:hypothetical protein
MAFPVVQSTSVGGSGTATTTPTITLPTGIVAGDKVIIFLSVNEVSSVATAITWPAGWSKPANGDADNAGSQDASFIAYRDCDGTEGASISPTLTVSGNYSFACLRISGAAPGAPDNPVQATDGSATPGQPDPPANTPAGGAADYLWIAAAMWDSGLDNWSAYPTNYSGGIKFDSSDNGGVALAGIAVATRQLNAASEDPGAFTLTTADQYCAATVAVSPRFAALTGTVTASITEADIVAGGKTIIVTLTGATWIPA